MRLVVQKIPWYLSWKGLLLRKKTHPILFHTRFGIHTFGMQFPVDVLILDKKNIVRKIKQNLVPNRLFFWNPIYDTVIELPNGTIQKQKLTVEKTIELQTL